MAESNQPAGDEEYREGLQGPEEREPRRAPEPPSEPAARTEAGADEEYPLPERAKAAHISGEELVGKSWSEAFQLVRSDAVALLLGGVIAAALTSLTFTILAGPFIWGIYAMCWKRMRHNEDMKIGDVFRQFNRLGTSIGTYVLTVLTFIVGAALFSSGMAPVQMTLTDWLVTIVGLVLMVAGLYLVVAFLYALALGMDKGFSVTNSLKTSRELVHATGFWSHLLLVISVAVPGIILSGIFGLLAWLWFPIGIAIVAVAYERFLKPLAPERPVG